MCWQLPSPYSARSTLTNLKDTQNYLQDCRFLCRIPGPSPEHNLSCLPVFVFSSRTVIVSMTQRNADPALPCIGQAFAHSVQPNWHLYLSLNVTRGSWNLQAEWTWDFSQSSLNVICLDPSQHKFSTPLKHRKSPPLVDRAIVDSKVVFELKKWGSEIKLHFLPSFVLTAIQWNLFAYKVTTLHFFGDLFQNFKFLASLLSSHRTIYLHPSAKNISGYLTLLVPSGSCLLFFQILQPWVTLWKATCRSVDQVKQSKHLT